MNIAIIGGGPAGLRAAEVASAGGARVTVFDAKPSVGRKFLVAGRGGLNLTKSEPVERFSAQYRSPMLGWDFWSELITEFDPEALRAWARGLGIETFSASTGRVYPREMKAAPLLRRWVQRLRDGGVLFALRHRWIGLETGAPWRVHFDHDSHEVIREADAVIFAMGGGSWPDTGSDGQWISCWQKLGLEIAPFQSANCGWNVTWPDEVLKAAEGLPLKNIMVKASDCEVAGELLVTKYGLEGGAIYQLGPVLRSMPNPSITIDFKPSATVGALTRKLGPARQNTLTEAVSRWKLSEGAAVIIRSLFSDEGSPESLARLVKSCPVKLTSTRPLAEAISSAGGVVGSELHDNLMLRRYPGIFLAGEMIDWEAPTGGYLMQACFAMGARAARGALDWGRR